MPSGLPKAQLCIFCFLPLHSPDTEGEGHSTRKHVSSPHYAPGVCLVQEYIRNGTRSDLGVLRVDGGGGVIRGMESGSGKDDMKFFMRCCGRQVWNSSHGSQAPRAGRW